MDDRGRDVDGCQRETEQPPPAGGQLVAVVHWRHGASGSVHAGYFILLDQGVGAVTSFDQMPQSPAGDSVTQCLI